MIFIIPSFVRLHSYFVVDGPTDCGPLSILAHAMYCIGAWMFCPPRSRSWKGLITPKVKVDMHALIQDNIIKTRLTVHIHHFTFFVYTELFSFRQRGLSHPEPRSSPIHLIYTNSVLFGSYPQSGEYSSGFIAVKDAAWKLTPSTHISTDELLMLFTDQELHFIVPHLLRYIVAWCQI